MKFGDTDIPRFLITLIYRRPPQFFTVNNIVCIMFTLQKKTCTIGGVCYPHETTNPDKLCEECNADLDEHAWNLKVTLLLFNNKHKPRQAV